MTIDPHNGHNLSCISHIRLSKKLSTDFWDSPLDKPSIHLPVNINLDEQPMESLSTDCLDRIERIGNGLMSADYWDRIERILPTNYVGERQPTQSVVRNKLSE